MSTKDGGPAFPHTHVYPGAADLRTAAAEIERLRAELAECRRDAGRYFYLRNRLPAEVLTAHGPSAGVWIDCENEDGELTLLTYEDADAAIDAAIAAQEQTNG